MIILASDTSTKSISVCVCEDGKVLSQYKGNKGITHSSVHMPLIIDILEKAKVPISEIDLYACTIGPGSYTGIRIGVTTTKAMAYASEKKAIGVSTLQTLARDQKSNKNLICPVLDARNRRVFAAAFYDGEIVVSEGNYDLDEFIYLIDSFVRGTEKKVDQLIFCGDAANICEKDIKIKDFISLLKSKDLIKIEQFSKTDPNAFHIAQIALEKFNEKGSDNNEFSPFNLNANYISKSSAQRLKSK